jgi:hypothetical protein
MYRLDNWELGLTTNATMLGVQIAVSNMLPNGEAGLGLWASRRFEEGELVGYFFGKFVTLAEWTAILAPRHFDPTWRSGEEDYVEPVRQGIRRVMEVPAQQNGASFLIGSQQCPVAYINQCFSSSTFNVEIVPPEDRIDVGHDSASSAYQYIVFRVRTELGRGVDAGEEFQVDYRWAAEDMQKQQALYAAYLTQLKKRRHGIHGTFELMRMGGSATPLTLGTSSVVSDGSKDCAIHRKRASLEHAVRCYDNDTLYFCCKDQCHQQIPHAWVSSTRSA